MNRNETICRLYLDGKTLDEVAATPGINITRVAVWHVLIKHNIPRRPYGAHVKGKRSYHWKGGRKYIRGYIAVYKPEHPYASKSGYVLEHRLVAEQSIKRFLLPEEVIHHINHIKDDNRIENLTITDRASHASLHQKERTVRNRNKKGQFV